MEDLCSEVVPGFFDLLKLFDAAVDFVEESSGSGDDVLALEVVEVGRDRTKRGLRV